MAATITLSPPPSTVGGYGGGYIGPGGVQVVSTGGYSTALNLSTAQVIKASPGRLCRIVILGVVGTGGVLTFNDCATTGAATTANQLYTTVGTIAVASVITLEIPFFTGLVCSAVPTGGTVQINITFS